MLDKNSKLQKSYFFNLKLMKRQHLRSYCPQTYLTLSVPYAFKIASWKFHCCESFKVKSISWSLLLFHVKSSYCIDDTEYFTMLHLEFRTESIRVTDYLNIQPSIWSNIQIFDHMMISRLLEEQISWSNIYNL